MAIDIILYYGGALTNSNANKGLSFEEPDLKCFYTQINHRLQTLNELKTMVMAELRVNPHLHDIKITFCSPHEVFKYRINYKYMPIETDKYVKITFDKMERVSQVSAIELYIKLEPRAEVGTEEVDQTTTSVHITVSKIHHTTTSLPVTVLDAQCKSVTNVEDDDKSYDNDTSSNGEDFDDRDEFEERIDRGDFEIDTDDHKCATNVDIDDVFDNGETDVDNVIGILNELNTVPAYTPLALSFSTNTWANTVDPSTLKISFASAWQMGMSFSKGLIFANKEVVKRALTQYALKENKNFIISRSTKVKICAKCVDNSCRWYVATVLKPKLHGLWMVTVYVGPHTCMSLRSRKDGRMMNSNFIASEILKKWSEDHTIPIKYLRDIMEAKYDGHKPSYYKVWDAKQKAIRRLFGDWEESYQRLQKLLLAYVDHDLRTQVFYHTIPSSVDGTIILHYVFWSFGLCIAKFKYCKLVISIDGTHLYGKYKGKLLIAMATDANNKVFPLAFVIVDIESESSWGWFLECLRCTIWDAILAEGICIISDRHVGIKNAIEAWSRDEYGKVQVFHKYCLRHIASNFNTHFQCKILKLSVFKAGYATQESKFDAAMEPIKLAEIEAIKNNTKRTTKKGKEVAYRLCTYLIKEHMEMWTKLHDGERRYGAMTTNISECFNGVLKGARGHPIAAMVEFT